MPLYEGLGEERKRLHAPEFSHLPSNLHFYVIVGLRLYSIHSAVDRSRLSHMALCVVSFKV